MKILDRYILKQFVKTFLSVFVILFFIFILQTVWLFIAELAGKDLDFTTIAKFLTFAMPNIVPLVLPLSVLLASIMTFGDLSENYEFAAMKSSGVSLQRAMRSLIVFILVLAACAFLFANNIIPYSQYRFQNIKANIGREKPAMAITEGQFNDVGTFNIKVDKKTGPNGNKLVGVTIHKKSFGRGATAVIKAKTGDLRSSPDSNILQLVLHDGYQYEDVYPNKINEQRKLPFTKSSFRQYIINMDLSKLNENDVDQEQISNASVMLDLGELRYTIDSLNVAYDKEIRSYADNIIIRTGYHTEASFPTVLHKDGRKDTIDVRKNRAADVKGDLLAPYSREERARILDIARGNIENTTFIIDRTKAEFEEKDKSINSYWLSVYDKFVIAYSCLLMFFIGAPLGAIIRKGGLGLPIVFAILIFITFHFINTFGKKIAQENGIPAFAGAWMSSFVLTPLALFLTKRATNDRGVDFDFDFITIPFRKLFAHDGIRPSFTVADRVINLDAIETTDHAELEPLHQLDDETLIQTVYDARRNNLDEAIRINSLKVLASRGITQNSLFRSKRLFDERFELLRDDVDTYRFRAKVTLVIYLMSVTLALVFNNNRSKVGWAIAAFVMLVFFFVTLYKALNDLKDVAKSLKTKIGLPFLVCLLFGFPFYPLFHILNNRALRKKVSEHNL